MKLASECAPTSFSFERDTFPFANELVWEYHFDPTTGRMSTFQTQPPPTYSHRCFVLVRSVRQFLYHALFDSSQPRTSPSNYQRLVSEVVSRSPRRRSAPGREIIIPGYVGLREFSQECESILKANCGGPVQSYFVRSHWRMVFPITRTHQERMARQLAAGLAAGNTPIVHLFRFPRITINHGILLFGVREESDRSVFDVYDPNIPEHPLQLYYWKAKRAFDFPPTKYWPGGPLNLFEMFLGGLY
jgi:hypothetical protein